jgi:hypothetical protein
MNHIHSGHRFEQLAGEMGRESGAARRKIDRAWMGLGIGNELGDRIGRKRWIYQHDKRPADESRDRRDVADEIEIELIVERRVDCVRRIYKKERVEVSWRRLLFGLFIKRRPVQVAELLRTTKGLTADDMARLARLAQKAKEK